MREAVRYAIVIERSDTGYSAWVPDLPGCVAAGSSVEEVARLLREAIAMHVVGLRADGLPVPPPACRVDYVDVAA